jgi:AbrB family looped-hinge helix DNA binding protein
MKEIVSTITSKGQVTIPAEVRKHLGLNKREKIAFVIDEEGDVHLKAPHYPTVASLRGAAGSLRHPMSWEDIERVVDEERAEEGHRKLGTRARSDTP